MWYCNEQLNSALTYATWLSSTVLQWLKVFAEKTKSAINCHDSITYGSEKVIWCLSYVNILPTKIKGLKKN